MALLQDWLPPSRQNWELVVWLWQFFPLITLLQYSSFINRTIYTMGKTSSSSRFNIPGRIAWVTMELPGPLTLLYILSTLPASTSLFSLPLENKVLATLYVVHYLNRAIIAPLIAPSISPISPHVWAFAFLFQLSNGLSLGGWLGGYGPRTRAEWQAEANYKQGARMEFGLMVFVLGFLGNLFHDDELREIRRAAARNQARLEAEKDEGTKQNVEIARSEKEDGVQPEKGDKKKQKKGVDKVYMIPQNGLFNYVLYPHYFFEWIEWFGFYVMCGMACVPARNFVVNEIATMLPRAISGKQWYIQRFGKERIGGKKAVIPGII